MCTALNRKLDTCVLLKLTPLYCTSPRSLLQNAFQMILSSALFLVFRAQSLTFFSFDRNRLPLPLRYRHLFMSSPRRRGSMQYCSIVPNMWMDYRLRGNDTFQIKCSNPIIFTYYIKCRYLRTCPLSFASLVINQGGIALSGGSKIAGNVCNVQTF